MRCAGDQPLRRGFRRSRSPEGVCRRAGWRGGHTRLPRRPHAWAPRRPHVLSRPDTPPLAPNAAFGAELAVLPVSSGSNAAFGGYESGGSALLGGGGGAQGLEDSAVDAVGAEAGLVVRV